MGWGEVGQSSGGQNYLKIESGKKVKLHVLTEEPFSYFQHFFNSIQRGGNCPGEGCPACAMNAKDYAKRAQHAFVVVTEEGSVKIWQMGNRVAEQIKGIYDTYGGTLADVDLVVARSGEGKSTKYVATPFPAGSIDTASVDMASLPVLEEVLAPASNEDLEKMINGIDPNAEFDPEKLERAGQIASRPAPISAEESETDAPEDAPPAETRAPVATRPAVKPQVANGSTVDPKMPVVKDIMKLLATSPKYRTPQAKVVLFKKCAPGKTTVGSMTLQELLRVRNELKKA